MGTLDVAGADGVVRGGVTEASTSSLIAAARFVLLFEIVRVHDTLNMLRRFAATSENLKELHTLIRRNWLHCRAAIGHLVCS